jgi:shikimate dehydrogenase/3-dehydroquinate dehydratase type I
MTKIVASLVEGGIAGVSDSSKIAFREGADIVECRLDHLIGLRPELVLETRRAAHGPAIATLRSRKEGGRSTLTGARREAILTAALDADFEYVDLELANDRALLKKTARSDWDSEIITSVHLARPTGRATIERRVHEAAKMGDIAKVAMPCEHAHDALMLARLGISLSKRRLRYVLIGMGIQGQLTRVLSDRIGSCMVYACLAGKEGAPGQLDVVTQRNLLSGERTILGLIGHPVSHSVSKPMQEAALKNLGLVGSYLPMDFKPGTFSKGALSRLSDLGFEGVNVTVPHKGRAFELCDKKGEPARATGAVNTIKFQGSLFVGENTDVRGFSGLIDGKIVITRDTKALLVGAGGAARAVAYVLSQRQAKITVVDIEKKRADELARTFGAKSESLKRLWKSGRTFDLVVNCTPVGMKGVPGNPVTAALFGPGSVFVDIIFNPPVTTAMKTAEREGARVLGGLEMLVQQGAESLRIWTGLEPNVEAMREAARRALA